ncbi:MAG: replication initiation protein, partial [Pseudomonadota bacterium]
RLYEMLNQFAKSGVRQIELDELREAIDTTDKATRWSDFNRWVLRGLVNDINEHSNLEVHYRPIKKGRSVTTIRFTILVKRDWTPPSSRLSTQ